MTTIAQRFENLQTQLKVLAPDRTVTVVGVVKHQSLDTMREAIAAGIRILAHNYAQEGRAAMQAKWDCQVEWHFIGHIQSRKVKELVAYDCVQSIDRVEIAQALSERSKALQKTMRVLIEVNIGGEPQKSGISLAALPAFLDTLQKMPHLKIEGLMAMPPMLDDPEARRPYFRRMKEVFDKTGLSTLSMGTSEDYRVAVQEGATMIRLGTSLIGPRPNPKLN